MSAILVALYIVGFIGFLNAADRAAPRASMFVKGVMSTVWFLIALYYLGFRLGQISGLWAADETDKETI